jgi:hypothetical protein
MEAQLSPLQDVTHASAGDCASYRRYKNHQRPPPRCSGHWAAVRLHEVGTEPALWAATVRGSRSLASLPCHPRPWFTHRPKNACVREDASLLRVGAPHCVSPFHAGIN